ncbi:hypothetical protein REPUB_Repub16aG0109200 [Reevesia pubescens]
MAGSDENNPGVIGPSHLQGGLPAGGGEKFVAATGQNRRALSTINRNMANKQQIRHEVPFVTMKEFWYYPSSIIQSHSIYAITLAGNKKISPVSVSFQSNESEDCTIIDKDDTKASSDFDVPMFVQHTEAMMEEIDRMQEDEMEDVDE